MFIPSIIKSIQRNIITITAENSFADATGLTAVNLSYSIVNFCGVRAAVFSDGSPTYSEAGDVFILSSTSVRATRHVPGSSDTLGANTGVSFELIEFYPGLVRSVQQFNVTITGGNASNTVAITPLTTIAKSMLFYNGFIWTSTTGTETLLDSLPTLSLTSTVLVTASRLGNGFGDIRVRGTVIEFR
jgi:hypothetical protein